MQDHNRQNTGADHCRRGRGHGSLFHAHQQRLDTVFPWRRSVVLSFWKRSGLPVYLAGAVLPLALLGWLFRFRMLGSGDIKLFCRLGGIMGPEAVLYCIGFSFLTGAAISLALLISCGGFTERISYFLEYLAAI